MMMIQDPHWPPAVLCTAKQHASQQMRSPLNDKLRQFRNMVYSVTPKIIHQRTVLRALDSCCVCTIGSVTRISSNGLAADEWHGTKKERQNPLSWSPCVNTVCVCVCVCVCMVGGGGGADSKLSCNLCDRSIADGQYPVHSSGLQLVTSVSTEMHRCPEAVLNVLCVSHLPGFKSDHSLLCTAASNRWINHLPD
jgi:hypothetical protein